MVRCDNAGKMRFDLHVHASERSACAKDSTEEMVQSAIERGLDGMAFTDHGKLVPSTILDELAARYAPFCIYSGIELTVSGEDVLVLGVQDTILEGRQWAYSDLHTFVRDRGGFLALAHPFRFRDTVNVDLEAFPPDALELRSTNIKASDEARIRALAERLGLQLLCNSDAHRVADVGCYCNQLSRAPRDDAELVRILKAGAYRCDGGSA